MRSSRLPPPWDEANFYQMPSHGPRSCPSQVSLALAGRVATVRFASTTFRFACLATEWTAGCEFRLTLPVLRVVPELTKVTICSILSSVTPMIVAEPFLSAL